MGRGRTIAPYVAYFDRRLIKFRPKFDDDIKGQEVHFCPFFHSFLLFFWRGSNELSSGNNELRGKIQFQLLMYLPYLEFTLSLRDK